MTKRKQIYISHLKMHVILDEYWKWNEKITINESEKNENLG